MIIIPTPTGLMLIPTGGSSNRRRNGGGDHGPVLPTMIITPFGNAMRWATVASLALLALSGCLMAGIEIFDTLSLSSRFNDLEMTIMEWVVTGIVLLIHGGVCLVLVVFAVNVGGIEYRPGRRNRKVFKSAGILLRDWSLALLLLVPAAGLTYWSLGTIITDAADIFAPHGYFETARISDSFEIIAMTLLLDVGLYFAAAALALLLPRKRV